MSTLKRQKARKDYVCSKCGKTIKKGEEYYKFSLTRFQKLRPLHLQCKPTRSQMTGSEFLSNLYAIEDEMAALSVEDMEEAQGCIDNIVEQLNSLRDETEEKLYNMPDQLQEAPTGELLQGRVDSVEEMISELESIEVDIDEELSKEEKFDRQEEILQEIQDVGYGGE